MNRLLFFTFVFFSSQFINSQTIVLDTNGKTIKYTGTTISNNRFVQSNLRGSIEWFCIVDDSSKDYITDYSKGIQEAIDFFTPEGETSPIPFDNIVTTLITDMSSLFRGSSSYNSPIGSWDVSNTTSMSNMFRNAINFNQDITNWRTNNVVNMESIFNGASNFNQNIGKWNISNVILLVNSLNNSGLNIQNYDNILNSWSLQNVISNIELNVEGLEYSDIGEVGRNILINEQNNWAINGDINVYIELDNNVIMEQNNYETFIGNLRVINSVKEYYFTVIGLLNERFIIKNNNELYGNGLFDYEIRNEFEIEIITEERSIK
mgnify:CR=1 FL=1